MLQFKLPTKTEIEAFERRRQFKARIDAQAEALRQKKRDEQMAVAIASAHEIDPEAVAAEVDPPQDEVNFGAQPQYRGRSNLTVADIQRRVGAHYGVSRREICSARRTNDLIPPRQVAMYIAKELTPLSLISIGRFFGGRDHTTVIHGARKIARMVRDDARFALDVISLAVTIDPEWVA